MAELGGLPNYGYGAHIPAELLLQLVPGSPWAKAAQVDRESRKAQGEAFTKSAQTDADKLAFEREKMGKDEWAAMANALVQLEGMGGMGQATSPELQQLRQEIIRRMGFATGAPPTAPGGAGTPQLDQGKLAAAGQEVDQPGWLQNILRMAGEGWGEVAAYPLAWMQRLGSAVPGSPGQAAPGDQRPSAPPQGTSGGWSGDPGLQPTSPQGPGMAALFNEKFKQGAPTQPPLGTSGGWGGDPGLATQGESWLMRLLQTPRRPGLKEPYGPLVQPYGIAR